jgi:arylsulfatase A-like enzyme
MVDDCMGRVIDAFREQGIWDDALAVFTQDHGDCLGAHGLFQKFAMYEESAHVPLLVKPPGNAAGDRRSNPVGHVDIANTFCDYARVPSVPGAWGDSLRGLVEDADAPWRDATFCEFNGDHGRGYPTRGVMTDRYKYLHHFSGKDELYDVVADPRETRSLVDAPEHAARAEALRGRIADWMRETGDMLDMERDADFCPARWRSFDRDRGWRD